MIAETSALRSTGSTARWRAIRARILRRDRWTCAYCGRWANTVNHRTPRRLGGGDDEGNLEACCTRCQHEELRPTYVVQRSPLSVGPGGTLMGRRASGFLENEGGETGALSRFSPQLALSGDYSVTRGRR